MTDLQYFDLIIQDCSKNLILILQADCLQNLLLVLICQWYIDRNL